jgi:predicted DNA-binding transcriptional regulator AlpA
MRDVAVRALAAHAAAVASGPMARRRLTLHCMEEIIERLERIERALVMSQATYLDTETAAELTGISKVTLERWRAEGQGPPCVKLCRLVKYRRLDLDAFMEARLIGMPNSQAL